jgi:hypothetical protein
MKFKTDKFRFTSSRKVAKGTSGFDLRLPKHWCEQNGITGGTSMAVLTDPGNPGIIIITTWETYEKERA